MSVSNDWTGAPGVRGAVCVSTWTLFNATVRLNPESAPVPVSWKSRNDWNCSTSPPSEPPGPRKLTKKSEWIGASRIVVPGGSPLMIKWTSLGDRYEHPAGGRSIVPPPLSGMWQGCAIVGDVPRAANAAVIASRGIKCLTEERDRYNDEESR